MKNARLKGIVCVVAASMCYGITPVLTNAALKGGLPEAFLIRVLGYAPAALAVNASAAITNESLVCLSMLLACVISLILCLISKKSLRVTSRQAIQMAVFGGGCFTATMLLITYAYLFIPAGTTIVLNFTYPLLVAAASAIFFKERMSIPMIIAIFAAIVGVGMISGFSGGEALGGNPAIGVPLALASAAAYACYFIAGRRASYTNVDTSVANVYITGAAALLAFIIAAATGRLELPKSLFIWIILLAEGVLGYMVALRLLLTGIRLLGSTAASALNTLEPVFVSVTSLIVFGEPMGPIKIIGASLVLAAAVVCILGSRKSKSA